MYSINFPNMLSNTFTNLVKDKEATQQNLKLLLLSDKTGLFGDPYYGSSLKKLMFNQNDYVLKDLVIDEIYTCITTFMPQIIVERKNINVISDIATLTIQIKAVNLLDLNTDLYTIKLTQNEQF